eukprot:COSAG01_NODE_4409_length_5056_cov_1.452895_4_plen_124_part_00
MINPTGNTGIPTSNAKGADTPLNNPEIRLVLSELGLDLQLGRLTFNIQVLASALASEDTLKRIKKQLDDIDKSQSQLQPDPEILNLLGIYQDTNNELEFKIKKGGYFLIKASINELEESQEEG